MGAFKLIRPRRGRSSATSRRPWSLSSVLLARGAIFASAIGAATGMRPTLVPRWVAHSLRSLEVVVVGPAVLLVGVDRYTRRRGAMKVVAWVVGPFDLGIEKILRLHPVNALLGSSGRVVECLYAMGVQTPVMDTTTFAETDWPTLGTERLCGHEAERVHVNPSVAKLSRIRVNRR